MIKVLEPDSNIISSESIILSSNYFENFEEKKPGFARFTNLRC